MTKLIESVLVSELEDPTQAYKSLTLDNLGWYVATYTNGDKSWVGFLKDIMRKLPTCKFVIDRRRKSKLHVYLPSNLYAMGWVGFGDFRLEGEGVPTITVFSHNISNEKYDSYREQHHMLMSTNPKRALKNALGYLRPYTPFQIANGFARDVMLKVDDTQNQNRRKIYGAKNNVVEHQQLATELRVLVENGYQFVDKEFGDLVASFVAEVKEHDINTRQVAMYYVRGYTLNGQEYFDTQLCDNMHSRYSYSVANQSSQRYTSEELPQAIAGKLAVLMMCEEDEYIDGVGVRLPNGVFYVNK
jgi:hypothetical protein